MNTCMLVNFEGATFNRGFNRALGSLLAGILAIAVAQTALSSGRVAEPIIMGLSIFLIGIYMFMFSKIISYKYILYEYIIRTWVTDQYTILQHFPKVMNVNGIN